MKLLSFNLLWLATAPKGEPHHAEVPFNAISMHQPHHAHVSFLRYEHASNFNYSLQVTCISGMTTWPPKANMTVPRELKVPKVRSATLPERLP
jgi:hypothetical protein